MNIYWNCQGNCTSNPLATATADNTGSFQFTANVPSGTYWRVPITGIGQTSKTTALAKIIVYKPTLALAPLRGLAGTPLTISSYGFRTHEHVDVYWNNGSTPIITGRTNDNGYLAPTVYTVPSGTTPGTYSVKIVSPNSHLAIINTFTVTASSSSNVAKGLATKYASANANGGWPDFGAHAP